MSIIRVSRKYREVVIQAGDEHSVWKEKVFSAGQAEEARSFLLSMRGKKFHKWDESPLVDEDGSVCTTDSCAPQSIEDMVSVLG